jgi:hypothetical protein
MTRTPGLILLYQPTVILCPSVPLLLCPPQVCPSTASSLPPPPCWRNESTARIYNLYPCQSSNPNYLAFYILIPGTLNNRDPRCKQKVSFLLFWSPIPHRHPKTVNITPLCTPVPNVHFLSEITVHTLKKLSCDPTS